MAIKKMSIFNAKKVEFTKINSAMTLAKCYVLALGKNANYSHFSEENVDRAFPTLNYAPVVGHIITDDNDVVYLGGHDYEMVVKNGFKLKSLCIPLGVVVQSDNPEYEEVIEDDGTKVIYLIKNIILWSNRYPELIDTFYDENVFCNQSMEINCIKYETLKDDPKYTDIVDFEFDALCMLGKSDDEKFNVTPCFPNAKIVSNEFSLDDEFKKVFEKFKKDLLHELKNTDLDKYAVKGDENMEEDLANKEVPTVTNVDDIFTKQEDPKVDNDEQNLLIENFSMKYREKNCLLSSAIKSHLDIKTDKDGDKYGVLYAYLNDFDDENVFFELETRTEDGDWNYKKYKQQYEIDDNKVVTLIGEKTELFLVWLTQEEKDKVESDKDEYSKYQETHKYDNSEVEELIAFKKDVEYKITSEKQEELFNEFKEELSDKKEFKKLIDNKDNYSFKELEKECYFIRGLYAQSKNRDSERGDETEIKFSIEKDNVQTDKYEHLFKQYLKK